MVSHRVSRISRPPGPMEELFIQSLGFLMGFREDIKIPRPHETINHTMIRVSFGVSRRYQSPLAQWNN